MKRYGKNFLIIIFLSLIFIACTNEKKTDPSDKKDGYTDVKDGYYKEDISIQTQDSITLSADYFYKPEQKDKREPCVVLIHQFKSNKEQWAKSFIDSLLASGIKVLTFDIRGHGGSQKVDYDLKILLSDNDKAPNDIKAVFKWLFEQKGVDTNHIGVMGTSIGGNLGLYSMFFLHAKACVSVSNSLQGFTAFTGIDPRMMGKLFPKTKNVLLICGNKDGDAEQDQRAIFENFIDDPREIIVYDSEKHGKYLIEEFPDIYNKALNWFKKYL